MKSFMFKEFLLKQVVAKVKTQTRRTHGLEKVNENPSRYKFHALLPPITEKDQLYALFVDLDNPSTSALISCKPKYQIGDICYLKENYAIAGNTTHHHIYQADYDPEARKKIKWKSKFLLKGKQMTSKPWGYVNINAARKTHNVMKRNEICSGREKAMLFFLFVFGENLSKHY